MTHAARGGHQPRGHRADEPLRHRLGLRSLHMLRVGGACCLATVQASHLSTVIA